jgi:hypothetical protein
MREMSLARREALMLAAAALLVLILMLPNAPFRHVPSEDAGVFIYVAGSLPAGAPYRDVWDHKPPGIYLVDALGLAVGGLWGIWLFEVTALLAAVVLSYRALVAGGLGSPAGPLGTLAWLVAAPRLYLEDGFETTYPEVFALPLQMAALLLFIREEGRPAPTWRTAAIGALAAFAALLKPTVLGVWIAIALVLVVTRARKRRWADLGRRVLLLVLPAGVILAAVIFWLAAVGALSDALDEVIRYNAAYTAFASPADRFAAIASGLRLTLPSGLALLAVGGWLLALRGARSLLVTVALVALPLELLLASAGRGYHYYFIAWLPAMGILAGYVASRVHLRVGNAWVKRVLFVPALLMVVQPAVLVSRLTITPDDGSSREAATYIREHSGASDRVLVWGSRTEILVLADRRSPTRYVYGYAALATRGYASAARIDELVTALEREKPLLIVDVSKDSFVTPPLDRTGFIAWTSPEPQYAWLPETARIIDFVEANYERVSTLPQTGWPVWRLRSR